MVKKPNAINFTQLGNPNTRIRLLAIYFAIGTTFQIFLQSRMFPAFISLFFHCSKDIFLTKQLVPELCLDLSDSPYCIFECVSSYSVFVILSC